MFYKDFDLALATVSPALWIAAILLLQYARDAAKSVSLGAADQTYSTVWVAKTSYLLTALFQTPLFWALIRLLPDHETTILRLVGGVSLVIVVIALRYMLIIEEKVISYASPVTVLYLNLLVSQKMVALALKVLIVGYLLTIVAPLSLPVSAFLMLCLYFGLSIAYASIFGMLQVWARS